MDLHDLTISKVKEDLRNKRYSSVELTKEYINRIKTTDKKLNAFVTVTEEAALQQSKKADEMIALGYELPLLKVPLSIKDNFCTENIRTTAASFVLEDFMPPYNATVVEKLYAAGAI